jgi:hypothetical protein
MADVTHGLAAFVLRWLGGSHARFSGFEVKAPTQGKTIFIEGSSSSPRQHRPRPAVSPHLKQTAGARKPQTQADLEEFALDPALKVMAAAAYHHQHHPSTSGGADPSAAYAVAMAHHQQQQASASSTTTPQPPAALRRAVYVHISDLTSAYNIDHAMLEEELTRAKREATTATAAAAANVARKQQLGKRGEGEDDPSRASSEAVSTIASGSAAAAASSSLGGVPTELDTNPSQKRLHPPRVGYNLCVYVLSFVLVFFFHLFAPGFVPCPAPRTKYRLSHSL